MLVLSRGVGQEIVIDGNIRVKVVLVKGQTIRLGITAPTSVPIQRLELLPECPEGAPTRTSGRSGRRPGRDGAHRPDARPEPST
jgi:carbon storage regulator